MRKNKDFFGRCGWRIAYRGQGSGDRGEEHKGITTSEHQVAGHQVAGHQVSRASGGKRGAGEGNQILKIKEQNYNAKYKIRE